MLEKINKNKSFKIKNNETRFTQINSNYLYDKRINASDYKLLAFYFDISFNKNESYYSIDKIAELINMHRTTIIKINKKLELLKIIKITKRFQASNIITINKYSKSKKATFDSRKKRLLIVEKSDTNNNNINNNNKDFDRLDKNETEQDLKDFLNETEKIKNNLKK